MGHRPCSIARIGGKNPIQCKRMFRSLTFALLATAGFAAGWLIAQSTVPRSACFAATTPEVSAVDPKDPTNALLLTELDRFHHLYGSDATLGSTANGTHPYVLGSGHQIIIPEPLRSYAQGLESPARLAAWGYLVGHGLGHLIQWKVAGGEASKVEGTAAEIELNADIIAGYWACSRIEEQNEPKLSSPLWKMSRDEFLNTANRTGAHVFPGNTFGSEEQRQKALRIGYFGAENQDFGDLEGSLGKNSRAFIEWTQRTAATLAQ